MAEGIRIGGGKKSGAHVWKKLTAQGGDFVDFVVSDSPTTYPDGGTQGGYWYEKVVDGIPLEALGCTEFAIDKFTLSSDQDVYLTNSYVVTHSLGKIPRFALLYAEDLSVSSTNYYLQIGAASINRAGRSFWSAVYLRSPEEYGSTNSNNSSISTNETISITGAQSIGSYLKAGIEYTLITMA